MTAKKASKSKRSFDYARNTMWSIDPDDLCIIGGKFFFKKGVVAIEIKKNAYLRGIDKKTYRLDGDAYGLGAYETRSRRADLH